MSLVYLASPYSKYPAGREQAYKEACHKAAQLMLQGFAVFCPIAHSHSIETEAMNTQQDGDWWLEQDFAILKHCDQLLIYKMPGWEQSYGVLREQKYARALGIPVEYIEYDKNRITAEA